MQKILLTITPQQWVILGAFLVILIPIAVGFSRYKKLSVIQQRILLFCVIAFCLDGIGRIFWIFSIPNLFLGHLSTIAEFLLLANVYRFALWGFIKPKVISTIMILFTALAVINTLFLQGFKFNNSNIKIIESAVLIILTLIFFYKLAREMMVKRLEEYPMFWINSAVLIYFSSSLFVFLYSNFLLLYSKQLGIQIWFIHALFFILFYIILAFSLWIVPPNSNSHG